MKKMLAYCLLVLLPLVGCADSPTAPTQQEPPPPLPISGSPSHLVLEFQKKSTNHYAAVAWGNPKLGMKKQIAAGDSLSGGKLIVREYSCGDRKSTTADYANGRNSPRDNSDTTIFTDIVTCSGPARFELWVQSFYVSRGQEELIQHTLQFAELRNSPGFRIVRDEARGIYEIVEN